MTETINQLLGLLGLELPAWGLPVLALVIMVLLLPAILRNMRITKARKLIAKSWIEQPEERMAQEDRAFSLVENDGAGLVAVADEALRRGRMPLVRRAVQGLAQLDTVKKDRKRLRKLLAEHDQKLQRVADPPPETDEVAKPSGA